MSVKQNETLHIIIIFCFALCSKGSVRGNECEKGMYVKKTLKLPQKLILHLHMKTFVACYSIKFH